MLEYWRISRCVGGGAIDHQHKREGLARSGALWGVDMILFDGCAIAAMSVVRNVVGAWLSIALL